MSDSEFSEVLSRRDKRLWLEMDSSHYYVFCVHLLVRLFPSSQFVVTVRDPISWLDSFVNDTAGMEVHTNPWTEYRDFRMGRDRFKHPDEERSLANKGLYTLDGYFSYWSKHYDTVLDSAPPSRLLMVKTTELGSRTEEFANFVGVPRSSLNVERSHSNKAYRKLNFLNDIDPVYLQARCLHHCATTMGRVFPDRWPAELVSEAIQRLGIQS